MTFWTSVVAWRLKLLAVMLDPCVGAPVQLPAAALLIQLPAIMPGKATEDGPRSWSFHSLLGPEAARSAEPRGQSLLVI